MVELWDLARYIESNPDQHEQRWRLAKKLYASWEYRHALEHLLVLKSQWSRKINVTRYLAATYYRLGRYEEAAQELREAIETWSNEVALREQLARVLEVAGQRDAAAAEWQKLLEIDPQHAFASRAVQRLRSKRADTPQEALNLGDSDSGIDLRLGKPCPSCGAHNSQEFDRCWQCHAPLGKTSRRTPTQQVGQALSGAYSRTLTFLGAVAIAGLIGYGVWLTVHQFDVAQAASRGETTVRTVNEFFINDLLIPRAVTGGIGLIAWPIALWVASMIVGCTQLTWKQINMTGLFLAAATYLVSWPPQGYAIYAPLVPLLVGLAAILLTFGLPVGRALALWALQSVLMAALYAAILFSFTGFGVAGEVPAIARYAARQGASNAPGVFVSPVDRIPYTLPVTWQPTGSAWLDEHANMVGIEIRSQGAVETLMVEFRREGRTLLYREMPVSPFRVRQKITAGQSYELVVGSTQQESAQADLSVTITGVLTPRVAEP